MICRQPQPPIEFGQIGFVPNLLVSIQPTFAARRIWRRGKANPQRRNFRKSWTTAWNCWTEALARLGVARANALQAKTSQGADADAARVRALAAYKDFLTVWKDADLDIPILKEVKAEYAKLQ